MVSVGRSETTRVFDVANFEILLSESITLHPQRKVVVEVTSVNQNCINDII